MDSIFLIICICQGNLHQHINSMTTTLIALSLLTNAAKGAEFLHAMDQQRPYFDDTSPRNVTAVADETAILKCRVKNKGNRTVSWMRKRDLHILTTNIYTYTGDQRFSVIHPMGTDDWDLKIDYAQQRDSGIYECQVNTEPKINLAVLLEVTAHAEVENSKNFRVKHHSAKAARAKILGSTEIHVKRDSTIALACSVNIHASSVSWYHGASIVDFDSLRGGISLETEKTDFGTTSRLMLTRASLRDSGNYTCMPNGAIPASVRVHVLTGEQPAAMQTSCASTKTNSKIYFLLLNFICFCLTIQMSRTRGRYDADNNNNNNNNNYNKNNNNNYTFISQTASIQRQQKQQLPQVIFHHR